MLSSFNSSPPRRFARAASSWFNDARHTLGDITLDDLPIPHRRQRRSPWPVALIVIGLVVVAVALAQAMKPAAPSPTSVETDTDLQPDDPRVDIV